MRFRRRQRSRRRRFALDRAEQMRQVQKNYKGPRGKIHPRDLFGFSMGDMVEFTHPKTGERAYGKIVDFSREMDGTVIAELSVKSTMNEAGDWIRYPDFYDFQYLPMRELEKAPRGAYPERVRRRAKSMKRRHRKTAASYGTKKLLEEIYNDKRLEKDIFNLLSNIAMDADLEVSPELEEYEYAPGVVYLAEDMEKYFKQNFDLAGFGFVDWTELAQAFIDREGANVFSQLLVESKTRGKRQRKMKRRQATAETLTYDPNYSGIGKFNSNVDEEVYGWSLEGWGSEQLGSAAGFGYHELLEIPEGVMVNQPEGDWTFQAAIIAEDSNGFVYVTYYDTVADGRAAWAEIEADYEEYLDEVRRMNPDMDEDELY